MRKKTTPLHSIRGLTAGKKEFFFTKLNYQALDSKKSYSKGGIQHTEKNILGVFCNSES